jgi:hypothetical protein
MIIGDCPYENCDNTHMIPIADNCPKFAMYTCEACGRAYWLLHSRIDPQAFTHEEFHSKYEVDETSRQIKLKEVTNG